MNNKLLKKWFVNGQRVEFKVFIEKEMKTLLRNIDNSAMHKQDDKEYIYKSSVLSALFSCTMLINYSCVDTNGVKPWFMREKLTTPLTIHQFEKQVDDIINWFSVRPPSQNYASLIYTQTMIAFLTTMEIR